MATKPITLPRLWADNAVYTTGPFIGQPGKVTPSIGVANEGHRPGSLSPTAAEHENYQQNRLTDWVRNWLFFGDFNGIPDAHIVETNSAGRAGLWGLDVDNGNDETAATFTGNSAVSFPVILATGTAGTTVIQADVGNGSGTGFGIALNLGTPTGFAATLFSGLTAGARGYLADLQAAPSGTFGYRGLADATSVGDLLRFDHSGTGRAFVVQHLGTPVGGAIATIVGLGAGNSSALQLSGTGTAYSLDVDSSATAGGGGVFADMFNNTGFALRARTAVAATTASRALSAEARGAATAVEATAINGDGVTARSTGSGGSALYLPGRATDPTVTFNGHADFNTTSQTLVVSDQNAAGYRDVWTSAGGLTIGAGTVAVTQSNGAWVTAATLALTGLNAPRRGGRSVVLEFVCDARVLTGGATAVNLRIFDVTADPVTPIFLRSGTGSAANAGYNLVAGTSSWQRTIVVNYPYTVPLSGDRTFRVEVQTATADSIAVRDCVLKIYGQY